MKNKHEDQQQDQETPKFEMEEKQPLIFIQVFEQIYKAIIWCLLGFKEIPSPTRTSTADDISSGSTSCKETHHQSNIPLKHWVCEDGNNDNVNDGKDDDDDDECDGYRGGGGNDGGDDGDGDGVIDPGTDSAPIDSVSTISYTLHSC